MTYTVCSNEKLYVHVHTQASVPNQGTPKAKRQNKSHAKKIQPTAWESMRKKLTVPGCTPMQPHVYKCAHACP